MAGKKKKPEVVKDLQAMEINLKHSIASLEKTIAKLEEVEINLENKIEDKIKDKDKIDLMIKGLVNEKDELDQDLLNKKKPQEIKIIEKEVIKNVPVEVIKEVIKEVEVEKIVEKEVKVPFKVEVIREVKVEKPYEVIVEVEKEVEKIVEVVKVDPQYESERKQFKLDVKAFNDMKAKFNQQKGGLKKLADEVKVLIGKNKFEKDQFKYKEFLN